MNRRHFLLSLPAVAVAAKAAEATTGTDELTELVDFRDAPTVHRYFYQKPFIPTLRCEEFFGTFDLELQECDGCRVFPVYGSDGRRKSGEFAVIWQRRGARAGRDDFYTQTYRDGVLFSETPYRMK